MGTNIPSFRRLKRPLRNTPQPCPIASPSANETKTRNNNRDQNFNRSFISETDNLEIKEIMGLLARISPLRLILDFHEDTILSEFYFYDTKALEKSPTLTSVREKILGLGVGLFNGVDNPNDPALGYLSIDGYIHQQPNPIGAIDDWLMSKKMVERSITPEIPGQISSELKAKIIDTIIETLILPEYGKAK